MSVRDFFGLAGLGFVLVVAVVANVTTIAYLALAWYFVLGVRQILRATRDMGACERAAEIEIARGHRARARRGPGHPARPGPRSRPAYPVNGDVA